MSYKEDGWKLKYIIEKVDGSPVDPDAEYFVLRLDKDPHARVAALAYADSVEKDNPVFATDIRNHVAAYGKGEVGKKEQKEILSEIRTIEEFDSWLAFAKKQKEKYAAG